MKILGDRLYLRFKTPETACSLLIQPGDLILQKLSDSYGEHELFGGTTNAPRAVATSVAMRLGSLLSFRDFFSNLRFGHTEVIYRIEHKGYEDIISWSFYPPMFEKGMPEDEKKSAFRRYTIGDLNYRNNYVVYRARALTDRGVQDTREESVHRLHALEIDLLIERIKKQKTPEEIQSNIREKLQWQLRFGRGLTLEEIRDSLPWFHAGPMSNCADFGNWALCDQLSSWWNVIPGLRVLISTFYPPEAIDNPDSLADSIFAKKICEVSDRTDLVYPRDVDVQELINSVNLARESLTPENRSHAEWVYETLKTSGVIEERLDSRGRKAVVRKFDFIRLEAADFESNDTNSCKSNRRLLFDGVNLCEEKR